MGLLFGIPVAVAGAALLIGGIVGYFKLKGSGAKTASAAAAAAGIAIWVIILFVSPVFQETTGNPGPEEVLGIAVIDYNNLTEQLTAEGVAVEETGELLQPFFSISGKTIKADGQDIQIFEYANGGAMAEDAALVSPDGFSVGTMMLSWVDSPHFYKSGRIIVIYIGSDAHTLQVFEGILGPQFAGR